MSAASCLARLKAGATLARAEPPPASQPVYSTTRPSSDGIGKVYMGREIAFVMGHQGRVQRLALVLDGPGLDIAARLAGSLLHPDVRHFPVAAKDEAIRWAATQPAPVG